MRENESILNFVFGHDFQKALAHTCDDLLLRHGLYVEVPSILFDARVKLPVVRPLIEFFAMVQGKIQSLGKIVQPDAQYSPLFVHEEGLMQVRIYALALLEYCQKLLLDVDAGRRIEVVRSNAIQVVEDLFENPSPTQIDRCSKVVGGFVELLSQDPSAYLTLSRLSSHDPYTLQHSVGVAINSIVLSRKLGMSSIEQLQEAGMAGLLHDIGKVRIRKEVINKPGPLLEHEWVEMKNHPQAGYELVKDNPSVPELSKRAILEHHEDREGKGYPNQLYQERLHVLSQIVSLSDVFNAITTTRSYSKALPPFQAFELIRDKMKNKVNPNLFEKLVLVYGGKVN